MKPYYEDDGITIYHGDCRDIISRLPKSSVVTDPPYAQTHIEWDSVVIGWAGLLNSDSAWVFGSLRFLLSVVNTEFVDWKLAQEVVWEKHNGSNLHADRFRRVHELVAHFYRGEWERVYKSPQFTMDATPRMVRKKQRQAHWIGSTGASVYASVDGGPRHMRSVIKARSMHGSALHPTQKPIDIVSPLISYSIPPGGLVLDPFMGSGTTLVAAKQLGRKAIGIETEEKYCEIAAKRLAQGVFDL